MPNPKYFQRFPTYDAFIEGHERTIIDLSRSVTISPDVIQKRFPFYEYVIGDGERPDHVSYRVYGDSRFAWIILIANNIYDIWREWPLSSEEFKRYIIDKYGSITKAKAKVNAYYTLDGIQIDFETFLPLPDDQTIIERAYEYETKVNEDKRRIKIIQKRYVNRVQSELKNLFE